MNYKPIYGSKKKKTAGTTANDLNQFKANFQSLSLSKPETTISFSFALRRLSFYSEYQSRSILALNLNQCSLNFF